MIEDVIKAVGFLGSFKHIAGSGNDYGLIPNKTNPQWIIPLTDSTLITSSLALYQPSLKKAKALKGLMIFLARLGLAGVLIRDRLYFQRNDEGIKKIFGSGDLTYAIFTGTEGSHRKVTVQVMDREGTILGYIKVAGDGDIDKLLDNEAEILGDLSRLEIEKGLFPKVLHKGKVKGTSILVLDTLKSTESTFSSVLNAAHVAFLSEVFLKTSEIKVFGESGFAKGLRSRKEASDGMLPLEWEKRCARVIDYLEKTIGGRKMLFGLCHRDFTPWNTFFHEGRLYVFDWEYARKDYPPLLDVFHFIVQDGILVRHLKPEELMRRVIKDKKWVSMYSSLVGIKESLVMPLLICYLLDISLLYIEREEGKLEAETLKTLETWGGMMDLAMTNSS
jgi:hypothetical protein